MSTAIHREVKGLAWVAWHGLGAGRHACKLSCSSRVQLFATSWTVAHQVIYCRDSSVVRALDSDPRGPGFNSPSRQS